MEEGACFRHLGPEIWETLIRKLLNRPSVIAYSETPLHYLFLLFDKRFFVTLYLFDIFTFTSSLVNSLVVMFLLIRKIKKMPGRKVIATCRSIVFA